MRSRRNTIPNTPRRPQRPPCQVGASSLKPPQTRHERPIHLSQIPKLTRRGSKETRARNHPCPGCMASSQPPFLDLSLSDGRGSQDGDLETWSSGGCYVPSCGPPERTPWMITMNLSGPRLGWCRSSPDNSTPHGARKSVARVPRSMVNAQVQRSSGSRELAQEDRCSESCKRGCRKLRSTANWSGARRCPDA